MKILSYDTRVDELPYYAKYAAEIGIQYDTTEKPLTAETATLAAGYDGVSVMSAGAAPYSPAVYAALAKAGITYFSARTVGIDNINLKWAHGSGLHVARVPAYSPNAISELAVTLMVMLLRNTQRAYTRVKEDQNFTIPSLLGRELRQQTVGIIGTGRIGRIVAQIVQGFGAKVVGYDIYRTKEAEQFLTYVDTLPELLKQSTVISLHMPLTESTRHMINSETIKLLPNRSIIINTARGGLIDSRSLVKALEIGKVGGAGLDVYEKEDSIFGKNLDGEPINDPIFDRLLASPRVIITPHIAFYTDEAVREMVRVSLQNLYDFNTTGNSVNEVK